MFVFLLPQVGPFSNLLYDSSPFGKQTITKIFNLAALDFQRGYISIKLGYVYAFFYLSFLLYALIHNQIRFQENFWPCN